jgi:hypothetical protein
MENERKRLNMKPMPGCSAKERYFFYRLIRTAEISGHCYFILFMSIIPACVEQQKAALHVPGYDFAFHGYALTCSG